MNKKNLSIILAGLCFFSSNLMAWQRNAESRCKDLKKECEKEALNSKDACKYSERDCTSPREVCKKRSEDCKEKAKDQFSKCRQNYESCLREMHIKDESSFRAALSYNTRKEFDKLSTENKKLAMDFADNNHMMPDDAVRKITAKRQKPYTNQ